MKLLYPLLLIGFLPFAGFAQTKIYVDAGNTGTQNGQTWSTAYADLQTALDSSAIDDSIFVASGVYYPVTSLTSSTNPRYKSFHLWSNRKVYGGFNGTESSLSERASDSLSLHGANATILSGDIGTTNDTSDNSYHVLAMLMCSSATILDGFTIENGNANGNDSIITSWNSLIMHDNYGGGIYNIFSFTRLKNIICKDNLAARGGGAMKNRDDGIEVQNSVFLTNRVTWNDPQDGNSGGGAIHNEGSSGAYTACTFRNNSERHAQGGGAIRNESQSDGVMDSCLFVGNQSIDGDGGAGIYCATGSTPTISHTSFKNNGTTDQGGGMYNDNSVPQLNHCIFINNTADGGAGAMENDGGSHVVLNNVQFLNNTTLDNGGAIQNWMSSPRIIDCLFEGNEAGNDGGGLFNYNTCSPTVTNCIFRNNEAGFNGGAIYNRRACDPVITNTMVYDNTAGEFGGGIYTVMSNSAPCNPVATNVTITRNTAGITGGGAYDDGAGASRVRNSIIRNNSAPTNEEVDAPAAMVVTAVFYTIIGNEFYTFGSNPPTVFSNNVFLDPVIDDFHMAAGSPGIDAGDSTFFGSGSNPNLSGITTALDGNDRIMGSNVDLGVYETCADTNQAYATISVIPDDSVVEGTVLNFTSNVMNAPSIIDHEWRINGVAIPGTDPDTLQAVAGSGIQDGDVVTYWFEADGFCMSADTGISNPIAFIVSVLDTGDNDTAGGIADGMQFDIRLYPNPVRVREPVYLHLPKNSTGATWAITDIHGRLILPSEIAPDITEVRISTDGLKPGVYYVHIKEEKLNRQYGQKFIIIE